MENIHNKPNDCGCNKSDSKHSEEHNQECCISICELLKIHEPKFTVEQYLTLSKEIGSIFSKIQKKSKESSENLSQNLPKNLEDLANFIKKLNEKDIDLGNYLVFQKLSNALVNVNSQLFLLSDQQMKCIKELITKLNRSIKQQDTVNGIKNEINKLKCPLQKAFWWVVDLSEFVTNADFIEKINKMIFTEHDVNLNQIIVGNPTSPNQYVLFMSLIEFLCNRIEKLCIPHCVKVQMKNSLANTMITYLFTSISQKQVIATFNENLRIFQN